MLAAVPSWLDGNVALGSLVLLLVVAVVVLRLVRKLATRVALLGLLLAGAMAVVVQQEEIEQCGSQCSCELFALDVNVPFCEREFPG